MKRFLASYTCLPAAMSRWETLPEAERNERQAESQEAAAKLFLAHPHFTIFPGEGVEVMEILPIPSK